MSAKLSEQEQLAIIKEVEEKYSKFLDPNFDASIFLKCRDNFTLTEHIESVKIFEMNNAPINPTFTIAIPTYNRCETLKEAIDSALNQDTDENYEIIVVENVDDFNLKTPAQEMLEKEYRGKLTYYKNKENIGLFGNWNRCLTLAKGQWVCILHSDDMITQNYIAVMKQIIKDKKYTTTTIIGNRSYPYNKNIFHFFKIMLRGNLSMDNLRLDFPIKIIPPNSALHNKQECLKLGGYNSDEYPSGDMIFYYRAYHYKKVYVLQKILQKTTTHLSIAEQPKTIVPMAIIDLIFILHFVKPKYFSKVFASDYIGYYLDHHLKHLPYLYSYLLDILQKKGVKRYSRIYFKICKMVYLFMNFFRRFF